MTDPNDRDRPIDPERIAALIDGKLGDAERQAVLAELDASPEAFEVYADAVAALRDEGGVESTSPAMVIPLPPPKRRRRFYAGFGAIAAALIVIVGLPLLRDPAGSAFGDPQALVAALDRPDDAVSVAAAVPWSELRGGDGAVATRSRAVRVGVRVVDLEVLLQSGDTAAASRVARQIGSLLQPIPGATAISTAYLAMANSPTALADARRAAAASAEQAAGATNVRLGAWLEAARLAASTVDSAFFAKVPADRALSTIPNLSESTATSVARLRQLLNAQRRDYAAIQATIVSILRELAAPGA